MFQFFFYVPEQKESHTGLNNMRVNKWWQNDYFGWTILLRFIFTKLDLYIIIFWKILYLCLVDDVKVKRFLYWSLHKYDVEAVA